MTRPDLAFTYFQLSKFVQSPGPVHLAAAERALAYLRGTYNEGITYCDPGEERVGHTYSFLSLLSLSKDWTVPDGVL
jgi:hypothetical protein